MEEEEEEEETAVVVVVVMAGDDGGCGCRGKGDVGGAGTVVPPKQFTLFCSCL